jgi:hypothetical protein
MAGIVCTCHPSYAGKHNRRIAVQTNLGIKLRPYLNKTKQNKTKHYKKGLLEWFKW